MNFIICKRSYISLYVTFDVSLPPVLKKFFGGEPDNKFIFFTSKRNTKKAGIRNVTVQNEDIYYARNVDGYWDPAQPLPQRDSSATAVHLQRRVRKPSPPQSPLCGHGFSAHVGRRQGTAWKRCPAACASVPASLPSGPLVLGCLQNGSLSCVGH